MLMNVIYFAGLLWAIVIYLLQTDSAMEDRRAIQREPVITNPKRERTMAALLETNVHTSERFVVTGNIGLKLVIKDKKYNKVYEPLEYYPLNRFRNVWDELADNNKDKFLCMTIVHLKERKLLTLVSNNKVA